MNIPLAALGPGAYILIAVIALVIIAIIAVVLVKKFSRSPYIVEIETEKRETLALSAVITFFKQPDVLAKLQASKDLTAVALREKRESGSCIITLCIYDKSASRLVLPLRRFEVSKLADDLSSLFGDKDMIVLQ